jgi:hypothetical protein
MIALMDAIQSLRPNAQCVISEDAVVRWDDDTQTQPTDAEIATERARLEAKLPQLKINEEARDYLLSTDWLLLRELDGGVAMTAEMKQLRADARARVI